ncbi:MAG: 4-hydroxythreonine-4-phosphate dehydrogenase PdxA, partial [Thermosynechococcaceae cyanobacterium]
MADSAPPPLAIALGDPAGIGPEVILKALADPVLSQQPMVVFGDRTALEQTYCQIAQVRGLAYVQQTLAHPDQVTLADMQGLAHANWVLGTSSAMTGEASFRYLEAAIAQTLAGNYRGIVTGPIAKSAWKAAGHLYPGQTELLAQQAGVQRFGMLFVATSPWTQWQLRTLLATTHIPLATVSQTLTTDLMTLKLDLLIETLQTWFGIERPKIAIAGLNPHSGEQGQLGTEEVDWLMPWVKDMGDRYPHAAIDGPIPPDTLWVKPGQAWFGRSSQAVGQTHDAYLALYHDQGLIPVKLMAFDRAVNTTIG